MNYTNLNQEPSQVELQTVSSDSYTPRPTALEFQTEQDEYDDSEDIQQREFSKPKPSSKKQRVKTDYEDNKQDNDDQEDDNDSEERDIKAEQEELKLQEILGDQRMDWKRYKAASWLTILVNLITLAFGVFDIAQHPKDLDNWMGLVAINSVEIFVMILMIQAINSQKLVGFKQADTVNKFVIVFSVLMLAQFAASEMKNKYIVLGLIAVQIYLQGYFIYIEEMKLKKKAFGVFGDSDSESEGNEYGEQEQEVEERLQEEDEF